jgi:hypothetical protein
MNEITIRAPHPGMSTEELAQTWDDLLHIANISDELLREVLAAMFPDAPMPEFKPSPYPESGENHRIWCAAQFAVHCLGDYDEAIRILDQIGIYRRAIGRPRTRLRRPPQRVVRRQEPEY